MINKIKYWLFAVSGYLYVWLVLGNIAGPILVYMGSNEMGVCYPYGTVFGAIDTRCESWFIGALWGLSVVFPRIMITMCYIATGFLIKMLEGLSTRYFYEFIWWLFLSIPSIFLIILPGYLFWKKKYPKPAIVSLIFIAGLILYNGSYL